MLVSVFADASFDPDTGAAGWGAWVKAERGLFQGGGPIKSRCVNSQEAELVAIINAVAAGFSQAVILPRDDLLLQTDNLGVVGWLKGRPIMCEASLRRYAWFASFITTHRLVAKARHVKGHRHHLGGRFWVNGRCDSMAKKGMRDARSRP